MATYYRLDPRDLQQSEATTIYRQFNVQVGTAEAKTITVSQACAAFTTAGATGTTLEGLLFAVTPTADDLDTLGELAWKLVGATDTDYVHGQRVVPNGPDELHLIKQAVAGTVATDSSDNTIAIKDTDDATVLATLTKTTVGTVSTWLATY